MQTSNGSYHIAALQRANKAGNTSLVSARYERTSPVRVSDAVEVFPGPDFGAWGSLVSDAAEFSFEV